jgi:hypothetical protein
MSFWRLKPLVYFVGFIAALEAAAPPKSALHTDYDARCHPERGESRGRDLTTGDIVIAVDGSG